MNPHGAGMTAQEQRAANAAMVQMLMRAPIHPYAEGGYVLRVVRIRGRRTGRLHDVPLAVTLLEGTRWLCAPDRSRDWAQNLAAVGGCLIAGDIPARTSAVLSDTNEAAQAIAAYRAALTQPIGSWPFPLGSSIDQIRAHSSTTAVFRLGPLIR
jgi:hypothetical protein